MAEIDNETKQELSAGEYIKQMTETRGWAIVEEELKAKIIDLQMIGNVTGSTADDKMKNMEARAMAVDILYRWLQNDVRGRVVQAEQAKDAFIDKGRTDYIDRG